MLDAAVDLRQAIPRITPVKSRYIRLAENGNLPRNNAPRLSTDPPALLDGMWRLPRVL
jgi:hypothetical protein